MQGLSRLRNMFRVPDLRNKILFTIFIIAIFRLGSHIPVPYVDFQRDQGAEGLETPAVSSRFLDLFSGGALTNVAVFFLGIMPYITASIIMQLLGVVIPKLEQWQQEGQTGQKKITQWTRYLTVALAIVQSTAFVFALKRGDGGFSPLGLNLPAGLVLIPDFTPWKAALIVLTWTAGTAHGDVARRADHPARHRQRHVDPDLRVGRVAPAVPGRRPAASSPAASKFAVILVIAIGMIVGIVTVESGQRRIPVQFAKRVVGRRMYGGQSTYIPLKVNQSGVIPVIFASSLLSFPALIANVLPWDGAKEFISDNFLGNQQITWIYVVRVRAADPVLRVLLHGDRVQPRAAGRRHPQAGRLHPGHPARAADRALPREGAEPHHAARAVCSSW